jgi:hypothetical protein
MRGGEKQDYQRADEPLLTLRLPLLHASPRHARNLPLRRAAINNATRPGAEVEVDLPASSRGQ